MEECFFLLLLRCLRAEAGSSARRRSNFLVLPKKSPKMRFSIPAAELALRCARRSGNRRELDVHSEVCSARRCARAAHLATSRDVGARVLCVSLFAHWINLVQRTVGVCTPTQLSKHPGTSEAKCRNTSSKLISGGCPSGVTKERSEFRRRTSKRVFDYFLRASKK